MLTDALRVAMITGALMCIALMATAPPGPVRSLRVGRLALMTYNGAAAYGTYTLLGTPVTPRTVLVAVSVALSLVAALSGRAERKGRP